MTSRFDGFPFRHFDDDEKDDEQFQETMRHWKVQCHRIKEALKKSNDKFPFEESRWMKNYLERRRMREEKVERERAEIAAEKRKAREKHRRRIKVIQNSNMSGEQKELAVKAEMRRVQREKRARHEARFGATQKVTQKAKQVIKKNKKSKKSKKKVKQNKLAAIKKKVKNVKVKKGTKDKKKGAQKLDQNKKGKKLEKKLKKKLAQKKDELAAITKGKKNVKVKAKSKKKKKGKSGVKKA